MHTEKAKGEREVEVFKAFVVASQLSIDSTSIEKRDPPEPDILCTHVEHGRIAFELVEICDPSMAALIAKGVEADGVYLRTADPSGQIIARKLSRQYQTDHPIELLCYTTGRVVTPAATIIPTIRPGLQSYRNKFRRAWLFSRGQVHDVWSQG